MLGHVVLAILTFAVTNMDDLLILSLYFASPKYSTKNIVTGQCLGIALLVCISLTAIPLGELFDKRWISLMGIVPILLGIKDLLELTKTSPDQYNGSAIQNNKSEFQFLNVALVTIANGGDNIGVYAPLFANIQPGFVLIYVTLFALLTGVWCLLAYYLVAHPAVKAVFSKYGKIILPIFLMLLGLYILKDFFLPD